MKNIIYYAIFAIISFSTLNAQENSDSKPTQSLKAGNVLQIGSPSGATYKYLSFPKSNFLIKRGGIANLKRLEGREIKITELKTDDNGETEAKIKLKNGTKFFNTLVNMTIDLNSALEAKEVKITHNN